jgi:hypothetical protein
LGELQENEYGEKVGSILAHTQQVVQGADEYIWLMADHRLGDQEYVTKSGKLDSSSALTWRIIIPAADSNIDWAEIRRAIGTRKGRIEYHLIEDPNDIKTGMALNDKIAGVTFPDITGNLDFNSGFRSSNPSFHKWCQDLFVVHWNKKGRRVRI